MSSAAGSPPIRVLLMGLDAICKPVVSSVLSEDQSVEHPYDLEKLMSEAVVPPPILLLIGPPPENSGINLNEVAQVARMQYQQQPIFFLTSVRAGFDRKAFQKNGFTDAFLIPIEIDVITQAIRDELSKASSGAIRSFREVKLIDMQANQELDFDTYMYMPVNRKHIKFSSSGDSMDDGQLDKLKKGSVNSVHVTSDQIQKFYSFAAKQLRNIQGGKGMSETERKERMSGAIRTLMSGVFNDAASTATIDAGRSIITDCQSIVKEFIVAGDPKNAWYEKLAQMTGAEGTSYSHAGNVATFASLFSLASGLGKPEDLALAGLLHDLGLADVPAEIQTTPELQWTEKERETYQKHVENTLNIIKFRKMILPDLVTKAIAQHHERVSGTGYPRGLGADRICIEAQILALADVFDEKTITREGRARMKPGQAFKEIYEENVKDASRAQFDLALLQRFMALFPEDA